MNKVIVSRHWHNPQINAFVTVQDVGAEMDLDDFLLAVLDILGKPTYIMTREQLKTKVMAAKEEVVTELKKATVHV